MRDTPDEFNEKLISLTMTLQARLGRLPTEDEILTFINGDKTARVKIWNQKWEGQE